MITKGCGVLGLIAAAMTLLYTLNHASAADFIETTTDIKLHPKAPVSVTTSSLVEGKIQFNQKFSSVSSLCFHFRFVGDLLDAGEWLRILIIPTPRSDLGIVNFGPDPKSDFVSCLSASDFRLPAFLDGKQDINMIMRSGSVTISSITATITGYSQ
jgi:hypothetical protein